MRDTFDEPRFYRGGPPIYIRPRRRSRSLLYFLFFMLGGLTTIALSFVVNPALLQAFLELFVTALFDLLVWIFMHPPVLMFSATFVMILVIISLLRQRGRWR